MNREEQIQAARQAKQHLADQIGDQPWCTGIGLAPTPKGGFAIRVNIDPQATVKESLPESFEGFPLELVEIPRYRVR